jgi:hypothetical protein
VLWLRSGLRNDSSGNVYEIMKRGGLKKFIINLKNELKVYVSREKWEELTSLVKMMKDELAKYVSERFTIISCSISASVVIYLICYKMLLDYRDMVELLQGVKEALEKTEWEVRELKKKVEELEKVVVKVEEEVRTVDDKAVTKIKDSVGTGMGILTILILAHGVIEQILKRPF